MAPLRILLVHNRYLAAGGEDESAAAEAALLRDRGHVVDEYVEDNVRIRDLGLLRTSLRTVWSRESYTKVSELLARSRYDAVSVQNFFPLVSPSVFHACRAAGVPSVLTLRNYRLLCAGGLLLREGPCEDCLGGTLSIPAIVHACYRGSRAGSGVVAAMLATHRLLGTFSRKVDLFVALTAFARDKHVQGGLPAEKIVVKPNYLLNDPGTGTGDGGFALFVGRLSPEKGLGTLLEAWSRTGDTFPLKIVGEGPLEASVVREAARNRGLELLGRRTKAEVFDLMKRAAFLVFPSVWYEGFPRTILEAFAVGLPVLASRLGSMTSLVRDGENGLFFEPGNAGDLADKVRRLSADPVGCARMGRTGRMDFESTYTADRAYDATLGIFDAARRSYEARGLGPGRSRAGR